MGWGRTRRLRLLLLPQRALQTVDDGEHVMHARAHAQQRRRRQRPAGVAQSSPLQQPQRLQWERLRVRPRVRSLGSDGDVAQHEAARQQHVAPVRPLQQKAHHACGVVAAVLCARTARQGGGCCGLCLVCDGGIASCECSARARASLLKGEPLAPAADFQNGRSVFLRLVASPTLHQVASLVFDTVAKPAVSTRQRVKWHKRV